MKEIPNWVTAIIDDYDHSTPSLTADRLRALWLQFEPKSVAGIKAEQRAQQETAGTPVPVLRAIGKTIGKRARKQVADYFPLARTLWETYGREGRAIALIFLGPMELAAPKAVIELLLELCPTCVTWEDADRLAMDALEPIVRKEPALWLDRIAPWLSHESKWVRRAGVTAIGRLPMKHPEYTAQCLALAERLLLDSETDVKKATSFAIRLCARGDVDRVCKFLARHVPPADPAATWVLCDAIRSMAKKLLPRFVSLLPRYQAWAQDPDLSARDRRSVESAVKTLSRA